MVGYGIVTISYHTIATGAESRSRPHKLLFHNYSNSVLLSSSPSSLILARKTLPESCMSWPFHSFSRHSLIKNRRGDLKAQASSFIHPNVISSQFLRFCSERPRYLFLPTSTRLVIGHNMNNWLHATLPKCCQMTKREIISPAKRRFYPHICGIWKQHEVTPNQFNLDPYYYYPPISQQHTLDCVKKQA